MHWLSEVVFVDPENDIRGNPGSAHRTLIRREAGVGDPLNERDI